MNDWFEWNGVKCTEYGIHVSEHPVLTIPNERVTFTDVPGRSGSLTMLEGDMVYDDMVLSCTCFIADPARIPEIAAWLRGSGMVTFANRQGGFYYAHVTNQIPFEKILRGNPHRSFAVTFRCKPFFYLNRMEPITITTSGSFVTNPGTVPAEPVITVYGTGDIMIQSYRNSVFLSKEEVSHQDIEFFDDMCQRYGIDRGFLEKGNRKKPYIDENYGWTYKVNKKEYFNFKGVCNLIDESEYLGFELMSPYSHGTSLATKLSSSATLDKIMSMIVTIYIALYRLVTLYCWDSVDESFDGLTESIESIIYNYIRVNAE